MINTNLKYKLIPVNGKMLFEKIILDISKEENNSIDPLSVFEEEMLDKAGLRDPTEIFMISIGTEKYPIGTLVLLSTYEPIGHFNGKQFFVANESAISVIISRIDKMENKLNEEGKSQ